MNIYQFELDASFDALSVFLKLQAYPYSLFLDSADQDHPDSRYSFAAAFPVETIEGKDGAYFVRNHNGQQRIEAEGGPLHLLRSRLHYHNALQARAVDGPPFQGGAAGFFGYDLARAFEHLPEKAQNNVNMPDIIIGIYDRVYAYDHALGRGGLYIHASDEAEANEKYHDFLQHMDKAGEVPSYAPFKPGWRSNFSREGYENMVQKTIDYIRAGDIFQANISQRFEADLPKDFDPFSHYLALREVNPAPFAGYFNAGDVIISSASPERFVTVRGDDVETKPIKGTRPHIKDDPEQDQMHRAALENSEKDRAENVMIVDLLRNDLSKCCLPEYVTVTDLCALETFASVHHLVSTIQGRLRPDHDAFDVLQGCFPGGSITGAPKIRAMEIIDELEPTRRGPYCGAMGYIGFDGTMDTNILIRTLVFEGRGVSFQVGGGIVVDSNPSEEYEETLTKAHGLFKSFSGPL